MSKSVMQTWFLACNLDKVYYQSGKHFMLSLIPAKRLQRHKTKLVQRPLTHLMQIGENGCWAASAWMIGHTVNNGSKEHQRALASSFLGATSHTLCSRPDCAVNQQGGVSTMPDVPLCLACKLRLLRYLIKNVPYKLDVHTQQFRLALSPEWHTSTLSDGSYEPKVKNVKAILQTHPIDAYCSVGKNAHYSVVYGCFEIVFDQKPFDMLMIADPWEFGPGICDFETFVYTGKYKRTGKRRELPNLHWNASLVA